MHAQTATAQRTFPVFPDPEPEVTIQSLRSGEEAEVLAFLAIRPIHTVIMAGMIRDNGLESSLNRGNFYACRDEAGNLEGVALIGHVTMFETQSDAALRLFADLARQNQSGHVIIGEQNRIKRFWDFYGRLGQAPRLICREQLFEQRWPVPVHQPEKLRLATLDDIEMILPVHAQMAFEESGINPLEKDPEGFRKRTARRIEQGRVWILTDGEKLIFKADIQSDTPEQIYLEGIYTSPEVRGQGYGLRCISQLSRMLLESCKSLCVLVNQENDKAGKFYRKAGYKLRGSYDTIYVGR